MGRRSIVNAHMKEVEERNTCQIGFLRSKSKPDCRKMSERKYSARDEETHIWGLVFAVAESRVYTHTVHLVYFDGVPCNGKKITSGDWDIEMNYHQAVSKGPLCRHEDKHPKTLVYYPVSCVEAYHQNSRTSFV